MAVHELRPTSGVVTVTADTDSAMGRCDSPGLWASVWPRVLAVLVVGSVGLPAAVASYWHLQEVAARFNPDSVLAYWLPLSVDGLLAAALVVVWSRRARGGRVGFGPWAAFVFGMIVTLLANAASVVPETEWARSGSALASVAAWMVALFPPVAFAISLELIAIVLRPTRTASRDTAPSAVPSAVPAPAVTSAPLHDTAATAGAAAAGTQTAARNESPARGSAGQPEVTAPMPVVAPDLQADADTASDTGDSTTAAAATAPAGRTKVAHAEALFIDAWTQGHDLSLAEVDRLVDGHRTATKAKRNLRDRGVLPPSERAGGRAAGDRSGLASVSALPSAGELA